MPPEIDEETRENIEKARKKFEKFEKEVKKEFCPEIVRTSHDIDLVINNLAQNIVRWYGEKKITLHDFCGRREKLRELTDLKI